MQSFYPNTDLSQKKIMREDTVLSGRFIGDSDTGPRTKSLGGDIKTLGIFLIEWQLHSLLHIGVYGKGYSCEAKLSSPCSSSSEMRFLTIR